MQANQRGRYAATDQRVTYRRRGTDPLVQPNTDRAIKTFHSADCGCPRCDARRTPPPSPPATLSRP